MKHLCWWCVVLLGSLWAPDIYAQGFGPRPGPSMGPEKKGETPEGPAEAAPEAEKGGEPELPPLPAWPGQETKKLQLFQMNGYFRFRWNLHHKLNLGMYGPGAPFYTPVSEDPASPLSCSFPRTTGGTEGIKDCPDQTLGGADVRFRLEPIVNVSEQVRIYSQIDVFDNLVLGSTPQGQSNGRQSSDVPLTAFSDSQAPLIQDYNSSTPAVLVKRAWAEVGTPFGQLRFGRMPSSWGLGIFANDGSCWNCNYGDNHDRLMFTSEISGLTLAVGYDFASTGPNSLSVKQGSPYYYGGQSIDLEKLDDVHQWFTVIGRIDPEEVIQDKVDRGELVLNYGLYFLFRYQDFDYRSSTNVLTTAADYAAAFEKRNAWMLTPDIWFKLLWKKLYIEFEGALIGGKVNNAPLSALPGTSADDVPIGEVDILQFGWALRSHYKLLRDSMRVGLEIGMASGDQDESKGTYVGEAPAGELNRHRINQLASDTNGSLKEFSFNYDYQVDLILFRELLSAVSNAMYFKPSIQYNIIDSFGARLDLIYSLAHQPISFPGNSRNLGLELDLDIFYRNVDEGFYAGMQYGVLFPFGALDRPAEIFGSSGAVDANVAHTLQGRLIVKF